MVSRDFKNIMIKIKVLLIGLSLFSIMLSSADGQDGNKPTGPESIMQKLEDSGVFEVPGFELVSEYDAHKTYDNLQGLFLMLCLIMEIPPGFSAGTDCLLIFRKGPGSPPLCWSMEVVVPYTPIG